MDSVKLSKENRVIKGESLADRLKKDKKLRLDIKKVLNLVLKQNLDVKKALLDYKASSIDLNSYKGKFNYNLYGKSDYSKIENSSEDPSSSFQGRETTQYNFEAGVSRKFRTGTDISVGLSSMYQNVSGAQIDAGALGSMEMGGKGYQSGLIVSVQQEILKNTFGISDRLSEKKIANLGKIQRQGVRMHLANLLVDALIGYWNILVAEESLEITEISLKSTIDIRDLIKKKQSLGLSEMEELFDWNSKVLQSKNAYEITKKNLYDARMAVARILNLDIGTDFDLAKIFKTTSPKVTFDHALKDALLKRVDLANQRTLLENSELEYKIAFHNTEPSLTLNFSAGFDDYSNEGYSETFNDFNKQWSIGFKASYPLGNDQAVARMSKAMLDYRKNRIELKRLQKEISDEIDSIVKQCDVMFIVYEKNRQSKELSKKYYNQLLKKFKQGRYNAVQLKLALDNYINMRHQELKSLVDYNITLLRRDLARNVVFEEFGINIDLILDD